MNTDKQKPSEAVRAKFPDNELLFSKRAMRDQIIAYLEELEKEEEKPINPIPPYGCNQTNCYYPNCTCRNIK